MGTRRALTYVSADGQLNTVLTNPEGTAVLLPPDYSAEKNHKELQTLMKATQVIKTEAETEEFDETVEFEETD